jgi:hypothetical protein
MSEEKQNVAECVIIMLIGVIALPLEIVLNSFVVMKLWNWLLIPTGAAYNYVVPTLTIGYTLCLMIVIGLFTKSRRIDVNKSEVDFSKVWFNILFYSWATPLVTLLFGFIVKVIVF